jgi:hypothetical protein
MELRDVHPVVERILDGCIEIHGPRRKGRLFRRDEMGRPEIRLFRIQDERAKRVFDRLHLRLAQNEGLFVARDFGLRFDDVDGWDCADLDAAFVVPQRFLARSSDSFDTCSCPMEATRS